MVSTPRGPIGSNAAPKAGKRMLRRDRVLPHAPQRLGKWLPESGSEPLLSAAGVEQRWRRAQRLLGAYPGDEQSV